MYPSLYSGGQDQKFQWKDAYRNLEREKLKIYIPGEKFIVGSLKIFRFPLNKEVIYNELGTFNDNPGDARIEFQSGYYNFPGYYGDSSWSKKRLIIVKINLH